MKVLGMDSISVNHDAIDLRCLEQLADPEQIQALSALSAMWSGVFNGKDTLHQIMDQLDKELSTRGLEILSEGGRLAPILPCRVSRRSMPASTGSVVWKI